MATSYVRDIRATAWISSLRLTSWGWVRLVLKYGQLYDKLKAGKFKPKLPDHIMIEKRGIYHLVLDPLKPDWFFCDRQMVPILDIIDGTRTIEQIIAEGADLSKTSIDVTESFIAFLVDELFLMAISDSDELPPFKDMILDRVYLHITSKCNQNCEYCYRDLNKIQILSLTLENIEHIITQLASLCRGITIILTGGEPTLHPNIVEICKMIKSFGFYIEINTNGSLLPDYPELLETVDIFNISLDGSKQEIHEALRGHGTYQRTLNAISFLQKKKAFFTIVPTITSRNIDDMPGLLIKYNELDCTFRNNVFMKLGKGEINSQLAVQPEKLCTLFHQIDRLRTDRKNIPFKKLIPDRYVRKICCGMGVCTISISPEGDVFPCQLMHIPAFKMGNIHVSSIEDIYWNSSITDFLRGLNVIQFDKCKSCNIKYLCGGGCRARALFEQGSIYSDDGMCLFWELVLPSGIWEDMDYPNAWTK